MFDVLDIGASGLQAQRTRLDTIAANIANVNTTRDAAGRLNPYRRRFVVLEPSRTAGRDDAPGVRVRDIKLDQSPFDRRYEPGNRDADADGYVRYPNIRMEIEYVNALEASRAYEANITLLETSKAMINSTLRLIA
jgi:flagellar basal-body rod protein FlgC